MTPVQSSPPIIDSRYQVVRLLGQGGMGAVHECRHVGTRRSFAVKVILAEAMGKPQALERFLREAAAAGAIKSPHVVDVTDVGLDRATGNAFMAMELLDGHDLAKQIEERGRLAPDVVLRIAAQGLAGLSAAHAAGVVHRDMKPANLFLAKTAADERVVKLLDFGIAKVQGDGDIQQAKLTRTGVIFGSPSYMSPEQASGAAHIDHRTDIWSFGAVMYEALTGAPPYSDAASLQDLIRRIWAGPPAPVSTIAPDVPAEVAAIVSRAMTHDAAGRYQSADEILADVKKLLAGSSTITAAMLGGAESPAPSAPEAGLSAPSVPPGTALVSSGPLAAALTPAPRTTGTSSAPVPFATTGGGSGTQLMPSPGGTVTHSAFGRTGEAPRGQRTLAYVGVIAAVTVALSVLAWRLVATPAAHPADAVNIAVADASSDAGGQTTSVSGAATGSAVVVAAPEAPADAGAPSDAGAAAVQSAAPASSAKAPSKLPAPGPGGKSSSVFSSGHRGI